jgi:hypothetical protein
MTAPYFYGWLFDFRFCQSIVQTENQLYLQRGTSGVQMAWKYCLKRRYSNCGMLSSINRLNPVIRILATKNNYSGLENIWKGAGGHH